MSSTKVFRSLLAVAACLIVGGAAIAAPVVIENGAEPAEGLKVLGLTELWRAGGEDDEIFFGRIGAVHTGPEGDIYLLDSQLAEIRSWRLSRVRCSIRFASSKRKN